MGCGRLKNILEILKKTWKEKIERFLGSINILVGVKGFCMIDSFDLFPQQGIFLL